ncbi:MAG: acyl-CoA desaturase [candidate division KSB1 bacterium]|nr:acyl-CoA desaturase [candidate division KSB1 bacterium]MDZ7364699.1 acyl-CoA desaturase [candidate division KSB1 bacterium]MDZ7402553.1 acyl-CoA desaturase [candidate division KSB1 bacterium]
MKKISFPLRLGFYQELKKRVQTYFEENGISPHADWRMVLKTVIILAWLATSYVLLVFFSSSLILAVISAFAVAQGFVLVGFNIMHDGAHGSYSKSKKVNWMMGFTLDLIGGSHMFWRHKHNILHHTYTNINELDDDIHVGNLMRFSPAQKRRPWHRFQHWYAFPLYGFMTLLWVSYGDFHKFFTGRIGDYELPEPSPGAAFLFFLTKFFYFGYMLILPMFFHPIAYVIGFFLLVHFVLGLTMATIFQLAHVVEDNAFPVPHPGSGEIDNEWAIHEVETTANFAPKSRLAAWYCGGLNFQIEHHLFPRVCHIHYPAISKIVERTCREFGIRYMSYPTLRAAIVAHFRFLKKLGQKEVKLKMAESLA